MKYKMVASSMSVKRSNILEQEVENTQCVAMFKMEFKSRHGRSTRMMEGTLKLVI